MGKTFFNGYIMGINGYYMAYRWLMLMTSNDINVVNVGKTML